MNDILYHYCSIETLELILKHKTFRFSSLGIVDDAEEASTSDFDNIGRYCFVSCWTDLSQESVEMWRTYTGGKNGVRLGFPINFFKESLDYNENDIPTISFSINKQYNIMLSPPYIPELIPVTYTKDDYLINIPVGHINHNHCSNCSSKSSSLYLETRYLGRFKRDYWSGQSEWRYRLIAIPEEYYKNHSEGKYFNMPLEDSIDSMKSDLINMAFDNNQIDFPFDEKILNDISITLSPLNSEEDNTKVEKILSTYKISHVPVHSSKLKMRK